MTKPIAPILKANLLLLARTYLRIKGGGLRTLSYLATADAGFFAKLTSNDKTPGGKKTSFTIRRYDEAVAWFAKALGPDMPVLKTPDHQQKEASNGTSEKGRKKAGGKEGGKKGQAKGRDQGRQKISGVGEKAGS